MQLVLASRRFSIVTGEAVAGDLCMVNVDVTEFGVAVTIGTFIAGLWVADRFGDGHVTVVATKTAGRDPFEHRAFVTLFARHFDVCAEKRKARELVVERQVDLEDVIRVLGMASSRQQGAKQHHGKSHDDAPNDA